MWKNTQCYGRSETVIRNSFGTFRVNLYYDFKNVSGIRIITNLAATEPLCQWFGSSDI